MLIVMQKFPRLIRGLVEEALRIFPSVMIVGARQVGKTTLCLDIMENYITFDDISTLNSAMEDPEGFVESIDKPSVIDEVQRVPEVLISIKKFIDTHKAPGTFLITGSANIPLMKHIFETLSGRVAVLEMLPLSMKEIYGKRENVLDLLFEGKFLDYQYEPIDTETVLSHVLRGGFPQVQDMPDNLRRLWFSSYTSTYVDRDVMDIQELRALDKFHRVYLLLSARVGSLLNKSSIARDGGVNLRTVENYIELLKLVFQVYLLSPYHTNVSKRVIKQPKVYLCDTGLLCHLLGIHSLEELKKHPMNGPIFENFVFLEFLKGLKYSPQGGELSFYRTTDGTEIDFIVRRGDVGLAIEIKLSKTVKGRDFRAIKGLMERDKSIAYGIVLYTGEKLLPFGERLFAVPVSIFF